LRFLARSARDGTGSTVRTSLEYFDPALPFAIAKVTTASPGDDR
jgi:hypothetical protein